MQPFRYKYFDLTTWYKKVNEIPCHIAIFQWLTFVVLNAEYSGITWLIPLASFAKEVNPRIAKCLLVFIGRLANHCLTPLVKEATDSFRHRSTSGHDIDYMG